MPKKETIGTAEICRRYGVGRSTISFWHSHRKTNGFPRGRGFQGRPMVWDARAVAEWIGARRAAELQQRMERAAAFAAGGAPEELLTAREVAGLLGYSGGVVIHAWRHSRPGYFPEPDERELVYLPGRGRPAEMRWRRATVAAWLSDRTAHRTQGDDDA